MLVQWQKDFESGHPVTDAEHREVVDLLNELDVLLAAEAPPEAVDRVLESLVHRLANHLQVHEDAAAVVNQVHDLRRSWRESATIPARSELRNLAHWWLHHLCNHTPPH